MSNRVTMPALGESVTEGTVTRWLKQVGDQVAVDEPLLEVSTDKVDTEIPSPFAGTVMQILVAEDETASVGADLAIIGDGQAPAAAPAAAPEPAPEPAPVADPPAPAPQTKPVAAAPAAQAGGTGQRVTMPALGESVTEGTVTRWLKQVGDAVAVDEPLLEVSTDKVDTEIPSPYAGVLTSILVGEDETADVGADLAIIGEAGAAPAPPAPAAAAPESAAPESAAPESAAPEAAAASAEPTHQPRHAEPAEPAPAPAASAAAPAPAAPPAADPVPSSAPTAQPTGTDEDEGAGLYVTPLVRKLAAQHGVDLAGLTGSGVGGRIRKQDVLDAAERAKAAPPAAAAAPAPSPAAPAANASRPAATVSSKRGTTEKMSRLRKVIAARMVESLQVSAQLTTVVEVDLTRVARLRDRSKRAFQEREGVALSYLPFLALAAAEALKQFPMVNASVQDDSIVYHGQENLSIAVDTERGLLTPVVRNAGDLNIAGLARAIADVADRTRNNKITPDDLSGGTFTITNTGSRGALFDTPIINQPQVAILGTGALVKRPVVVIDAEGAETIAIRSMMLLALSYDHRIVDGADAARFLGAMKTRLEEGSFEADLGL